uniref:Mitochondria-eating protein n=1 Tax=Panagrolaimus davidi TaxID=227884 RepID=A0A914QR76_9BILA
METSDSDDLMDYSIYRIMYRQAKNNHGIKNAKDVTTQIWETLFDFPSLKTCTRFNRFILDCVDVIWDLVAGIDGRMPRLKLDFECIGICFDPTRHIRSTDSNMDRKEIKYCIWPGLINIHDNQHITKAIMCT